MRAADLVNARADLIRRLGEPMGTPQGALHKMVAQLGATAAARARGIEFAQMVNESIVDEARLMQAMAKTALSYRVSEEMSALTEYAAQQLTEEDVYDATLPLSDCGLVYFERPVKVGMRGEDLSDDPHLQQAWDKTGLENDDTLPIRWMLWGPAAWRDRGTGATKPGILIHTFYDLHIDGVGQGWRKYEPDIGGAIADLIGRWGYLGAFMVPDGAQAVQTRSGNTSISAETNGRLVVALFRLLSQVVAVTQVEQADPKLLSKTAKRIKLKPQVTTIKLRRQKGVSREPGETMVEWSHRWVVRGFWRNQPYGSRSNPEYKRIWIAPYIKGPEDKPLIAREHVYSLER